jgi:glyoxylase-like metal-dependent hydrolase (beta-lactamase superfamily II)
VPFIGHSKETGYIYGFENLEIVYPEIFIDEKDVISFGNSQLEVVYTPGHAAGSICFINHPQKFVIVGDVLFHQSIGRTDLPTGDYDLLMKSIREKLFTLDKSYTVYSGHGPETTIGFEMISNPFLAELGF